MTEGDVSLDLSLDLDLLKRAWDGPRRPTTYEDLAGARGVDKEGLARLKRRSPVPVYTGTLPPSIAGSYDPNDGGCILLNPGVVELCGPSAAAHILLHELGHWVFTPRVYRPDDLGRNGYAREERQAEVFAYLAGRRLGIQGQEGFTASYLLGLGTSPSQLEATAEWVAEAVAGMVRRLRGEDEMVHRVP